MIGIVSEYVDQNCKTYFKGKHYRTNGNIQRKKEMITIIPSSLTGNETQKRQAWT